MTDTIFGQIARGEIPTDFLYEDDQALAFRDISPQAPTHILIVSNKLIPTANDVTEEDEHILGRMFTTAAKIAAISS